MVQAVVVVVVVGGHRGESPASGLTRARASGVLDRDPPHCCLSLHVFQGDQ